MPTSTPWGRAQSSIKMAPGVIFYSTASHGGIHLSPSVNILIPDYMRCQDGWYEEDCDWCLPVIALAGKVELDFSQVYPESFLTYVQAYEIFRNWHPDKFERFFDFTLKEGESYMRDNYLFRERTKDKMVTVSALDQNNDFVLCYACTGGLGHDWKYRGPLRLFLIPTEEYKTKNRFGFIIDPERHREVLQADERK